MGFVLPLGGSRYLVEGRTANYVVDAETGICSCPDHRFRHVWKPGVSLCRHGRLLKEYLLWRAVIKAAADRSDGGDILPGIGRRKE